MITNEQTQLIKNKVVTIGKNIIAKWDNINTTKKDDGIDVVTNLDIETEKELYKFFSELTPEFGFVGEEKYSEKKDFYWLVDPIDGTKWFAKQIPLWCISIALINNASSSAEFGLVYNPVSKQMYYTDTNSNSLLNEEKLNYNFPQTQLSKSQIILDLTPNQPGWEDSKDKTWEFVNLLQQKSYRTRAIGSGALSLCWLAQGMFGAYVAPYQTESEFTDIAAAELIAIQSGCHVEIVQISENVKFKVIGKREIINQIIDLAENTNLI